MTSTIAPAAKVSAIYRADNAKIGVTRLIQATARRHAEGLILQDWSITKATVADGRALANVEIEQAE